MTLVMTAMSTVKAWADDKGVAPENGKEYYIYCPASGKYFTLIDANADFPEWGIEPMAVVTDTPTTPWTVGIDGDVYSLSAKIGGEVKYYGPGEFKMEHYLVEFYAGAFDLSISQTEDGYYTINRSYGDGYLTVGTTAVSIPTVLSNYGKLIFIPVEVEDEMPTYERQMPNELGTICLPFPIDYDAANGSYKLYELSATSDDALTFTAYPSGTIAAGEPMVIKALGDKTDGKYAISITGSSKASESAAPVVKELANGYKMSGTFEELTEKSDVYYIAQNKFWYANSPIKIPANCAFINVPQKAGKTLNIIINDETTGIKAVNNEQLTVNNGKFIENGRVVVVKNGMKFNVNGQRMKY